MTPEVVSQPGGMSVTPGGSYTRPRGGQAQPWGPLPATQAPKSDSIRPSPVSACPALSCQLALAPAGIAGELEQLAEELFPARHILQRRSGNHFAVESTGRVLPHVTVIPLLLNS